MHNFYPLFLSLPLSLSLSLSLPLSLVTHRLLPVPLPTVPPPAPVLQLQQPWLPLVDQLQQVSSPPPPSLELGASILCPLRPPGDGSHHLSIGEPFSTPCALICLNYVKCYDNNLALSLLSLSLSFSLPPSPALSLVVAVL